MNALALRDNDDPSTSNQPPVASSTTPGQWLQHFGLSNQPTCHPFILGTVPSLPDAFPKLVSTLSFLLHLHTELRINHTPYSAAAHMHSHIPLHVCFPPSFCQLIHHVSTAITTTCQPSYIDSHHHYMPNINDDSRPPPASMTRAGHHCTMVTTVTTHQQPRPHADYHDHHPTPA